MAAKSKNTKKTDLNAMSMEDLTNQITDAKLRLKRMTFSHAITPIENPMMIKATRREIAKFNTAIRRKELGF